MEPTRNSVSHATSLLAARSALPMPPHHSSCPFATSATPAPVTWFFPTTSFMAFCNSSSVLGCGNSSFFCSAWGAAETVTPETRKQRMTAGQEILPMGRSLDRFLPFAAFYPRTLLGPKRFAPRLEGLGVSPIDAARSLAYDAARRLLPYSGRDGGARATMKRVLSILVWLVVAVSGAGALGAIAIHRGEPLNAMWFVIAALGCYLVAFRLYSAFVAAKVLALDDTRATPAERHEDGRDFVPTNKWVLFGHHFAAIAGPGPLVGPTLAAQFGYLPGTLWLIVGAAFGGCVQDFVILFCSIRRDGKSLGQMAREEVSKRGGFIAQLAVLAIVIILLGVIALVVVNALKASPWATFTISMTLPIALLLGVYLRFLRPGRVVEASIIGLGLVLFVVVAGRWVAESPSWAHVFTLGGVSLAIAIIVYGFIASVLPVWLLLAPRDYLIG